MVLNLEVVLAVLQALLERYEQGQRKTRKCHLLLVLLMLSMAQLLFLAV
jgi:hypothetical protein